MKYASMSSPVPNNDAISSVDPKATDFTIALNEAMVTAAPVILALTEDSDDDRSRRPIASMTSLIAEFIIAVSKPRPLARGTAAWRRS